MVLQAKRLTESAKIPTRGSDQAAGADLYADQSEILFPRERRLVRTGVAIAIPPGYVGLIWPRSGLAYASGLDTMAGVIDSDYRGEIKVLLRNNDKFDAITIQEGMRIAQLLIQPVVIDGFVEVTELYGTNREANGFGSTGVLDD